MSKGPRSNEQAAREAKAAVLPRLWCTREILAKLPAGSVRPEP